jgi:hypothetical protein
MEYRNNTCTGRHPISSSTSRGRGSRPDHFYQITVYYDIQDLHTAAEIDYRQPRILDLYQEFGYKRVIE